MTKKRELTEMERAECAKLKEIFNNKKKELGITQAGLAERFEMTQPAIGHYLNGTNALNAQIASQFAEVLQVSIEDFSERLAKEIEQLAAPLKMSLDIHDTMKRLYQAAKEIKGIEARGAQSEIARLFNSSPQTLKNWESRGMSKQGMIDAAKALGVSLKWLEDGQGEMIEPYRLPEKGDNFIPIHRQGMRHIPLLGQVEAGDFTEAVQLDEISDWRVSNKKCSNKAFALYVSGYSMHNPASRESFEPGDIILVDPELPYYNGSLVIAITDEGTATFKKLFIEDGKYCLKALNPEWTPNITPISSPAQICGVVYEKQVDF